jgi:hypothetical protein
MDAVIISAVVGADITRIQYDARRRPAADRRFRRKTDFSNCRR